MNIMQTLAFRHLKENRRQTAFTFVAITLSVTLLTGIISIAASIYQGFARYMASTIRNIDASADGLAPMLYGITFFLAIVIVAASVIVISNAFAISANERVRQFGVLKSVGATKKQIHASMLFEAYCLCLCAIPVGIIIGYGISTLGVTFASRMFSEWSVADIGEKFVLSPVFHVPGIAVAAVLSFLTVMLSVWRIASKVSSLPAISAIKQNNEIISPRKMRTSRVIQSIFGFEGTLAAKSLKRSKRKYRSTIVSQVTSIVLILVSTSFGGMIQQLQDISQAEISQPDINANVLITTRFVSPDEYAAKIEKVLSYPDAEVSGLMTAPYAILSSTNIAETKDAQIVNLFSMDSEHYLEYCKAAGINPGGIILLSEKPMEYGGSFVIDVGNGITVNLKATSNSTLLTHQIRTSFNKTDVNLLLPPEFVSEQKIPLRGMLFVISTDPYRFTEWAGENLDTYRITNNVVTPKELKRFFELIKVFVYGFIGILVAIGVTSLLATINSNIVLRTSEFAILQAVGLDARGLRRVLHLECLLYGIKSLMLGIPIGLVLSFLLYRLFHLEESFLFAVPWLAVILCVVGVFAVTFMSMSYASQKLRKGNVADAMRAVNI